MDKKNRKNLLKKAIILSLVLSTSTLLPVAEAEEAPSYDLDAMVVTATKMVQPIKDVPASVSVITAADIKKMNIQTIDQALRMASGVFDNRQKGLTSTTASVTLRGFNGQASTLVLLDGQPLNQAYAGAVTWSSVPIESVDRIEIVKGSSSALYGSNALGGVINIITKNPEKGEAQVSSKYESYNTWTNRLDVGDKLSDKWSYRFGFERKTTDGFPTGLVTAPPSTGAGNPAGITTGWTTTTTSQGSLRYLLGDTGKNTWDEDSVTGKFVYAIDDKRSLSLGVLHDKYDYGYGAGHDYLLRNGSPFTGTKADVGGGRYVSVTANTFLGLPGGKENNVYTWGYKDKGSGVTFNAGLNDVLSSWYISTATSPSGGTGRISNSPNRRWNADLQKELQIGSEDRMIVGINYRNDWIHNEEDWLSNWLNHGSTNGLYSQAAGNATNWALYAQNEHRINEKFSVVYGGRYDYWSNYGGMNQDNSANAYGSGLVTPATYYPDRSDSAFSPKVALQYKMNDTTGMHLSWGKAFQAPDLYTMYRSWLSGTILYDGNPNLKPQKVTTVELGWNKKVNEKTNVNITYFHNDITDMIYRQSLGIQPVTGYTWQKYQNAGQGKTDGVELEFSHRLNSEWTSFLNYTYQRAVISSNSANSASVGKLVQQAPERILNFGFDYKKDKWHGNLFASYISKRYNNDDNSDSYNDVYGSYDPYFIVNTLLEYGWDKNNTVTFGVNNLFNRQYFVYYVAPGRTYSVQMTHKF
jgi:iron complex outermembrane recepter protein